MAGLCDLRIYYCRMLFTRFYERTKIYCCCVFVVYSIVDHIRPHGRLFLLSFLIGIVNFEKLFILKLCKLTRNCYVQNAFE